jgi:hypothetical protein
MEERILAQLEASSWRPAVCKKKKYDVDVKIREIGPPDSVGCEAGKGATPAFATDDGAYTTTVLGRSLEREEKAACIFSYVRGGENLQKDMVSHDHVIPDEPLKLFVIAHEQWRHELARAPPANVRSDDGGTCAEVLDNVLDTSVLLNVLLSVFLLPPRTGVGLEAR